MASAASPMLVLVALSGRSLRLDVHSGVRVDAVQQALLSFTGIPLSDQLVMYNGSRLDPARTLGSYGLPVADTGMAEECPVFLYSRSFLRPGARLPEPEVLPDIVATLPPAPSALQLHHPLHSSPSPLVRGLPQLELHFQHDLALAKAFWDTSQLRVQRCRQLLSEQEVQARAADAARANVQVHFNHITASYTTFLNKFSLQHAAHAELLGSFESDLAQLARIQLHPGLQTRSGRRTLEDLAPVAKMRQWGEHCRRSHEHFGVKVSELGSLLQGLKQDVQGLLEQTPSVDLDQLGAELSAAEGAADELSLLVQSLAKDLRSARELVEKAVGELAAPISGSRVPDACGAMQAIAEAHSTQMLPQARSLDNSTAAFCSRCAEAKSAMTADVVAQLQRISGQQSRIRDLKSKLAAFAEVLSRQEVAFAELKMAHRIPSAYRMLLAECMRQAAWQELYSQQASRLEEHMGKLRAKELGRRSHFLQQVERYLPNEAITQAGLTQEPPRCSLSVTAQDQALLAVSLQDLQWLPTRSQAGTRSASSSRLLREAAPPSAQDMAEEMAYRNPAPHTSPHTLELEVATLKSELGSYIAAACMRELSGSEGQIGATAGVGAGPGRGPASGRTGDVAVSSSDSGSASGFSATSSLTPSAPASASAAVGPSVAQTASAAAPGISAVPGTAPASQPTWSAPEELLESMKRALKLKDDLLDKLQGQVAGLKGACAEQQQRIQRLEAQAASDAQAMVALQQQQQTLVAQLAAAVAATGAASAVEQQQLQRSSGCAGEHRPAGPMPLPPLPHGHSPHAHAEAGPGSAPTALFHASPSGSVGPAGSSPAAGPGLLSPQPLLLGPIALAALSTCRPGSAGPPTHGKGGVAVASGGLAGFAHRMRGSGSGEEELRAAADVLNQGAEVPPLSLLTTFSSAPLGAVRPGHRHSMGSLGNAAAGPSMHRQDPMQPAQGQGQGQELGPNAGSLGVQGLQPAHQVQGLGQMQQGQQQGQGEQEQGEHQQRASSASGEFALMGDTFSMHEGMPAGAMDEVGGPGDSPMGRTLTTRGSGEGFGSERLPSRRSGEGFGPGALAIRPCGSDAQGMLDTPPHFGSLPFASSLPRFGSLTNVAAALAQSGRRPSEGSGGLLSSSVLPNAVLASVMRAAGQEPEPLPWAHLRQSPPATPVGPIALATHEDEGGHGAGKGAVVISEGRTAGQVGGGVGVCVQEGVAITESSLAAEAGRQDTLGSVFAAGGRDQEQGHNRTEQRSSEAVQQRDGEAAVAVMLMRQDSNGEAEQGTAAATPVASAQQVCAQGAAPLAVSQGCYQEHERHQQQVLNVDVAAADATDTDVADEDAPDLDDILGGDDPDSGLQASTFLSATCD